MDSGLKQNILLVKLSSLGDVIHALPTLEALRDLYPAGGRITWLVEEGHAPLLEGHPALDQVWRVPRLRLNQGRLSRDLPAVLGLVRQLRARPFDLVIDLQGLIKSGLWVALARSGRKVGYDRTREFSYLPLTERLPPYDPEAHAVWRYLNVAAFLGALLAPPRFRLPSRLTGNIESMLAWASGRPLVVLHPGARWPTKLWPAAAWARLADWLDRDRGCSVLITGSQGDRELVAAITAHMQGTALNLAGRTSLGELTALLRAAALAITTDTGPMHLAAASGTPVVALFGPTAPWRTGPFGPGHQVVRLGLPCSPCYKRRCPDPRCLADLTPEAVQAACDRLRL